MDQINELDISGHNGIFNWTKAREKGVRIVYIKSSQRDFPDPLFKINLDAGGAFSEIQKGPYHFIDHSPDHYIVGQEEAFGKYQASRQMEYVLPYLLTGKLRIKIRDTVTGEILDITMGVDLEQAYDWPKLDAVNQVRAFAIVRGYVAKCRQILDDYALKDVGFSFYGSQYLMQNPLNPIKNPPWLAWYTEEHDPSYSYEKEDGTVYFATGIWKGGWALHQYSSTGDGIAYGNAAGSPYIDLNRLNPKYEVVNWAPPPEPEDPPEPEVPPAQETKVVGMLGVQTNGLTIRNSPKKTSFNSTLKYLYKGEFVECLEEVVDGVYTWARIGHDQWACRKEGTKDHMLAKMG